MVIKVGKESMKCIVIHWIVLTLYKIVINDILGIDNSYVVVIMMTMAVVFVNTSV